MVDIKAITDLHRFTVQRWHGQDVDNPFEGFLHLVCEQHQRNFLLWHQEDIARSHDVSDAKIAEVKRAIDGLNQSRNDHIEQLDDRLIEQLGAAGVKPQQDARLNTETPGSTIVEFLAAILLSLLRLQRRHSR